MQWRIITVGKLGQPWVRDALEMYLKRLQKYAKFEHLIIKEGPLPQVEAQIRAACQEALCVILDERGTQLRSMDLAKWIENQEISTRQRICLVIGGADGHSAALRSTAQACWSLSTLTLQHDLALIVLVEQIYRAYSIVRHAPYHRES